VTRIVENNQNIGAIGGEVFNDRNGNGHRDSGDVTLQNWSIYIDANSNARLDSGERVTTTDTRGQWCFTDLAAGTYQIRQVIPGGWRQTTPQSGAPLVITLSANQTVENQQFGDSVRMIKAPVLRAFNSASRIERDLFTDLDELT
jgi:hypothetical protein